MKKQTKESLQVSNEKLKKTLGEKSVSLKLMKHDLKIEASLERMRAVAMGMRKSEELIAVCEAMYKELTALGFTNIRNAQISIKNHANHSYFVTEYSDHAVVAMQEAPYDSSPIVKELYNEMEKSKDAFYQKNFRERNLMIGVPGGWVLMPR